MKPTRWILTYIDAQGKKHSIPYTQRAQARGAVIMQRAQGMRDVQLIPKWD